MASATTHMDEYICEEILKRLPVKTLVRFRCVCKRWNSLIPSSSFANHRLAFTVSSSDDSNQSHLLFRSSIDFSSPTYYCFYNPQQPHLAHQLSFSPVPVQPQSIKDPFQYFRDIDVVHGVVCLSHQVPKSTLLTLLWNPALHKYVEIPLPGDQQQPSLVQGFGFDGRTNDFKLVRNLTPGELRSPSFEVFSTREWRWRRVGADHIGPFLLSHTNKGCFRNGVIHWIGKTAEREGALLMFDCEREEFETMELPKELARDGLGKSLHLFIASCSGKLSVLVLRVLVGKRFRVAMWVMEEYGVASSWRKLTLDQVDVVRIQDHGLGRLMANDYPMPVIWKRIGMIDRPHQPINDYVFEPSLFLMDGKSLPYQSS